MEKSVKLASLVSYAQRIKDRLSSDSFPKRDNREWLKLDLKKTEAKIEKLKLEDMGSKK